MADPEPLKLKHPEPEPTHVTISAYIPIGLRDRLARAVEAADTTTSRWVTRAIEERLAHLAASSQKAGGSGSAGGPGVDVHIEGASTSGSAGASAPRPAASRARRGAAAHDAAASRSAKSGPAGREVTSIPKGSAK